jgi:hypothetical protein
MAIEVDGSRSELRTLLVEGVDEMARYSTGRIGIERCNGAELAERVK